MKGRFINFFIKFCWPLIKFVIINYGSDLVKFVSEEIKSKLRKSKIDKMEDALKNAKAAEEAALKIDNPQHKLKYFEIASKYREEADFQKKSLEDLELELDKIEEDISKEVIERTSKIDINDVFSIEGKEIKLVENQKLLDKPKKE